MDNFSLNIRSFSLLFVVDVLPPPLAVSVVVVELMSKINLLKSDFLKALVTYFESKLKNFLNNEKNFLGV